MNTFTASNGMTVKRDHNDDVLINRGTESMSLFMADGTALALREFFRAEEDERLGRWRWPENPDYVVYRMLELRVRVVHERDGVAVEFTEADTRLKRPSQEGRAARAYFDAHPEPKPWHEAKPGEVWVLDLPGIGQTAYVASDRTFIASDHGVSIEDERIRGGRRLYPEEVAP